MPSKFVFLYYNGEIKWDATIKQVHEYLRIQQPIDEWLDSKHPEFGWGLREHIVRSYDTKTRVRLEYDIVNEDGVVEENPGKDQTGSDLRDTWPCPWPITLWCEAKYITRDILINQSNLTQVQGGAENFAAPSAERPDEFRFTAYIDNAIYNLLTNLPGGAASDPQSEFNFGLGYNQSPIYTDNIRPYESLRGRNDATWKQERSLKVWLWAKAFNEMYINGDIRYSRKKAFGFDKNSLMDITPFVQSINTNTTKAGGTFQLNLIPVPCRIACTFIEGDDNAVGAGRWFIPEEYYDRWEDEDGTVNYTFHTVLNSPRGFDDPPDRTAPGEQTFNQRFQAERYDGQVRSVDAFEEGDVINRFGEMDGGDWLRQDFFFSNVIAENDIIFISFEDSDPIRGEKTDEFFMSVDEIVDRRWTMIGLVDSNSTSMTAETTDVSININGRDCMKLLLEDGTFFFQKSYANPDQNDTAFNNTDLPKQGDDVNALNRVTEEQSVNGVNRLITTGMIETLFNQDQRNVSFVFNLLISRLANIEICPSDIFEAYGDKRTKFQVEYQEIEEESNDDGANKDKNVAGSFEEAKNKNEISE